MHPSNGENIIAQDDDHSWVRDTKFVKVELLGKAVKGSKVGVICYSFN